MNRTCQKAEVHVHFTQRKKREILEYYFYQEKCFVAMLKSMLSISLLLLIPNFIYHFDKQFTLLKNNALC